MPAVRERDAEHPSISVVMCTFNGAPHVRAQLASIVSQLTGADQLLVSDDGSSDSTLATVQEILAETGAKALVVTAAGSGVVGNVEQAISLATRDVVVLADQDDIWREDKLARLREVFDAETGTTAAFSDATLIDASGRQQPGSLWRANGVDRFARRRLERGDVLGQLLRRNVVTGATLAVRTDVLATALPFPAVTMHDYWLALVAACIGPVEALAEPLIAYRVHDSQLVGPEPSSLRAQLDRRRPHRTTRNEELTMFTALRERVAHRLTESQRHMLDAKVAFLDRRANLPTSLPRRITTVVGDLAALRYHQYGRGFRGAGRDMVLGY